MNSTWKTVLISVLSSAFVLSVYHFSGLNERNDGLITDQISSNSDSSRFAVQVNRTMPLYDPEAVTGDGPVDFHYAAAKAMPAVVHIKSIRTVTTRVIDPFYELFGRAPSYNNRQQVSSGSGVVISPDGYIVTNNHVIRDADELTVTLYDNRTFSATVIGTDPSTDLGLIKIDAGELPTLLLANSDEVVVGEWVLAVGNPFSLASTATAGIVSAIGRDLEIIRDQMAIESFIQTDAAVNPGNSGGALVDLEGHLIGVNTAIASPTGTYAGYAFAVPANIVKKVISDLKEFGVVQRAFLGVVSGDNLNSQLASELGVDVTEGVYIRELSEIGGAYQAGIRENDIIVNIDGIKIRNDSRLLEIVGRHRPGDNIDVEVLRDGKTQTFTVTLTNQEGSTELSAVQHNELLNELGVEFRDLTEAEKERLGIERGILVNKLTAGKIRQSTDMRENFIILKVNGNNVASANELTRVLEGARGTVTLVGFYPRYNRLFQYEVEIGE